ncbi:MAG: serine/threonine-protein kinase [Polyangiaceae bacterium]
MSGTVRVREGAVEGHRSSPARGAPNRPGTTPLGLGPNGPGVSPRAESPAALERVGGVERVTVPKRLQLDLPTDGAELLGLTLGGRYVVESILGQGGMGTVYKVRHAVIGRRFALKVLRREIVVDAESVRRFIQEAKIAASVKHDGLIEVTDFGEVTAEDVPTLGTAKQPYFVMELLEGETLAARIIRDGPMPARTLAAIMSRAALALAKAHEGGIVHRDLKPDNVFLLAGEEPPKVKVLDFGVAKLLSGARFTRKGTVFGTPYYMSPEQAAGHEIDGSTDQYALGVVMYEALSGRVPFDDDTHMGVMTKHVFAEPEPIEHVVVDPAALGPLGPIVMRCLEKRPEARFSTMVELSRALENAFDVGKSAPFEGRPHASGLALREPNPIAPAQPVVPSTPKRGSTLLVGGTVFLVAVALGLGAVALLVQSKRKGAPSSAPTTQAAGATASAAGALHDNEGAPTHPESQEATAPKPESSVTDTSVTTSRTAPTGSVRGARSAPAPATGSVTAPATPQPSAATTPTARTTSKAKIDATVW